MTVVTARLVVRNHLGQVILDAPIHPDTSHEVRLLTAARQTPTTVRYERRAT